MRIFGKLRVIVEALAIRNIFDKKILEKVNLERFLVVFDKNLSQLKFLTDHRILKMARFGNFLF